MVSARGMAVRILAIDGTPFEEYQVEQEDEKTTSCYIASQSGQCFSIQVEHDSDTVAGNMVTFRTFLDGVGVGGYLCTSGKKEVYDGLWSSPSTVKRYAFTHIHTTDSEEARSQGHHSWKQLGLIEIRVLRCEDPMKATPSCKGTVALTKAADTPVHEFSKKSGTHRVGLGEEVAARMEASCAKYLDPKDDPYAILRIHYRPREILQAQGIIPRSSPSPMPQVTDDPVELIEPITGHGKRLAEPEQSVPDKRPRLVSPPEDIKPQVGTQDDVQVKREQIDSNSESDDNDIGLVKAQLDLIQKQTEAQLGLLQKRLEKMQARKKKAKALRKVKQEPTASQPIAGPSTSSLGPIVIDLTK